MPVTKGKSIKTIMIQHSRPNRSRVSLQSIFEYNSSGDQKIVYSNTEALGTNNTYFTTSRRFPLEVHLSKKVPAKKNRYLDPLEGEKKHGFKAMKTCIFENSRKSSTFSYTESSVILTHYWVFLKFHF